MGFLSKIFKSYSEKEVNRVMPLVEKINSLEPEMEKLSDEELRAKTAYFKGELANGKTLNDILPEAFAVMREASKRVLGMRHFDVQLIGGIILHQGRIAEMKTGEGKTLVATLPVYLNALEGKGVHVITVNEYLARRDSEWMGKVYRFLGLSVGLVLGQQESSIKREAYNADITYCTNSELGFDYLRDNMVVRKEDMVQRGMHYAILDEIDSILIDEARTPLIISGMSQNKTSDLYKKADSFVKRLQAKTIVEDDVKNIEQTEDNENYDYIIDLKAKTAALTGKGIAKAEQYFNLENYNDLENSDIVHNVTQALRANGIMKKDIDYIVKDGEVLIVDEFTGRIMYGRRYSDGLHQAIEAKEGVKIADESRTLATITYQNFFRLYDKLAGMTGTAMTEEDEFREIYHLDVIAIPTNRPLIRKDEIDAVYKNENAKYTAIVKDIKACHEKGQPVLVGTVSIEKSEKLSALLQREGLKHEVLNAKNHEKEAEIIAQAGKFGAVTIATNMAGRGTDIMLGGNSEYLAKQEMRKLKYSDELVEQATAFNETTDQEILDARKKFKELKEKHENEIAEEKAKVIEVGGLRIIGTERHESRRIDNQLRGRSGRQGDPGSTMFYLALDDDLLKIFGGDLISSLVNTDKLPDDQPFQVGLLGKTIERAQSRVEGQHFSARKYILSYDDVINVQREIIYGERRQVLNGTDIRDNIVNMLESACELVVETYSADMSEENFNKAPLVNEIRTTFNMPQEEIAELKELNKDNVNPAELVSELQEKVIAKYEAKEQEIGPDMRELERGIMLMKVDSKWMDHIDAMDELKNGIGLRAYGQKDPVIQYRIEGADMFDEMVSGIKVEVAQCILHLTKRPMPGARVNSIRITNTRLDTSAVDTITPVGESAPNKTSDSKPQPIVNNGPKVGRNDPCPCGSGKKYKNCCGKNQ